MLIFKILCVSFLCFICSCGIPLSKKDVNRDLFPDREDLDQKVKLLNLKLNTNKNLTEAEVFKIFNLKSDTPNLQVLDVEKIQTFLYGHSEFRGTPQELDVLRSNLSNFKGYAVPLIYIEKSGTLGWFSWTEEREGFDQSLVLIFDKGKLAKVLLEGRRTVNERDTFHLWEILWSTAEEGAKAGVKSAF